MNRFNCNENKSLVWDMLLKNGLFNNIDNDKYGSVQRVFDNTITEVNNSFLVEMRDRNHEGDLMDKQRIIELNKRVILKMRQNIGAFRNSNIDRNIDNVNGPSSLSSSFVQNNMNTNIDTKDYEKVVVFDKNLSDAKNEFDSMIRLKIPEQPDFTEKEDTPLPADKMDNMLARLMAERDNIVIPPPPPTTSQTNTNTNTNTNTITNTNTNTNTNDAPIKIEKLEDLFVAAPIKKKISFLEDHHVQNHNYNEPNIKEEIAELFQKIREINLKQDKILELLEKSNPNNLYEN